jgi:hypothetical protein
MKPRTQVAFIPAGSIVPYKPMAGISSVAIRERVPLLTMRTDKPLTESPEQKCSFGLGILRLGSNQAAATLRFQIGTYQFNCLAHPEDPEL